MATRDLVHNVKPVVVIANAKNTTTTLSSACDTQGFESVTIQAHFAAFGDTQSGTVYTELELQESSDNSTYTAVADSDLLFTSSRSAISGTATGTFVQTKTTGQNDTAGVYQVGCRGTKRYLKVNQRLTGTHTNGENLSVVVLLGHADFAPAQ